MGALLLALVLFPAPVQTGMITGSVTDSQGSGIPGATVQLEIAGAVAAEVQTGTNGEFVFAPGGNGAIRLIVAAPGFTRSVFAVGSGSTQNIRITLEPAPFFEAVQVTSSRSEVPATDPTVTAAVFSGSELMTGAPRSIDDALTMVAGFKLFP